MISRPPARSDSCVCHVKGGPQYLRNFLRGSVWNKIYTLMYTRPQEMCAREGQKRVVFTAVVPGVLWSQLDIKVGL
ncbi:hypothetical protein E2C01_101194 [Portunus trituberculatus]|uniref:Uncharacterized protein n=1 Tax=Portunus trituberculatus TaxID=210409 RepID=A0A5B7KJV4_PORTR|nr:hypothetical protein [Portunus trituberculatus]